MVINDLGGAFRSSRFAGSAAMRIASKPSLGFTHPVMRSRAIFQARQAARRASVYGPGHTSRMRGRPGFDMYGNRLTANRRVAFKRSAQLAGLWDTLATTAVTAVTYRLNTLQSKRAEADARLREAQEKAAATAAWKATLEQPQATRPSAAYQRASKLPILPLAIGGVALAGAAFFMLRKKR
jgi:hypothetical protein